MLRKCVLLHDTYVFLCAFFGRRKLVPVDFRNGRFRDLSKLRMRSLLLHEHEQARARPSHTAAAGASTQITTFITQTLVATSRGSFQARGAALALSGRVCSASRSPRDEDRIQVSCMDYESSATRGSMTAQASWTCLLMERSWTQSQQRSAHYS